MVVIEPVVLSKLNSQGNVMVEPLPDHLNNIRLLSELSEPLARHPEDGRGSSGQLSKAAATAVSQSTEVPEASGLDETEQPLTSSRTQGLAQVQFVEEPAGGVTADTDMVPDEQPLFEQSDVTIDQNSSSVPVDFAEQSWRCFQYGPFDTFAEVEAAALALVPLVEVPFWGEVEEPYTEQRHWVAVNAATSEAEVESWIDTLNSKGFRDHYRPGSAEYPFLISLGLFKDLDRAEGHLRSLKQAGVPAEVLLRKTEYSRRWLSFKTTASQKSVEEALEGASAKEIKPVSCDRVPES